MTRTLASPAGAAERSSANHCTSRPDRPLTALTVTAPPGATVTGVVITWCGDASVMVTV